MTGLFGRIFGSKKKDQTESSTSGVVEDLLRSTIQLGQFDLDFTLSEAGNSEIRIEFSGEDEALLRARDGQLLDAFQLFLTRALQHQFADEKVEIVMDVGGFREETNQALIDLADKLREIALSKGKTVYFRALPPKDRKVVHQYLADDERVKSRSVGEGHYKKIKIYPVKEVAPPAAELDSEQAESH